jgi:hypothetical protein
MEEFNDFAQEYEEDTKNVRYVTSFERIGIQTGIQKGLSDAVTEALDARFQQVPKTLAQTIQAIYDTSLLHKLHREAILVDSLERFEQLVDKYTIPADRSQHQPH